MTHLVAVLAYDGVVLGDLATPIEIFSPREGRDAGWPYAVRMCSAAPVVRTQHCALQPPYRLRSLQKADTVIVPGIEDLGAPVDERVLRALRRARERGARIASVCTGAYVLAAAGLLDGRRATTHWAAASALAARYPSIEVDPDVLFVDDGEVFTSAGAAASHDLCLHLVRRDLGALAAASAARMAVMPLEREGGQAQFVVHDAPLVGAPSLAPLLESIEAKLGEDWSVARMAQTANMSPRTFARRFQEQVGESPARWVMRARVRRAQRLLEETQGSIEEVAEAVGFGAAVTFRQRFKDVVGTSPASWRRTFAAAG